jgi:hypothetical protein
MRTTLTLDDDVAALLARVRKSRKTGLKQTVNEALRQGLRQMAAPPPKRKPYVTPSTDLGPSLIGNLDNVEEVLDIAEGPWRR